VADFSPSRPRGKRQTTRLSSELPASTRPSKTPQHLLPGSAPAQGLNATASSRRRHFGFCLFAPSDCRFLRPVEEAGQHRSTHCPQPGPWSDSVGLTLLSRRSHDRHSCSSTSLLHRSHMRWRRKLQDIFGGQFTLTIASRTAVGVFDVPPPPRVCSSCPDTTPAVVSLHHCSAASVPSPAIRPPAHPHPPAYPLPAPANHSPRVSHTVAVPAASSFSNSR
jgi:hypothetical protein